MRIGHPTTCQLCERTIHAGHTSYAIMADDSGAAGCPDYQPASLYRACSECGEAITWEIIREQLILDRTDAADGPPPSREPATDPAPS